MALAVARSSGFSVAIDMKLLGPSMRARFAILDLLFTALLSPWTAIAFETDQYDLPPHPLADIGDEVAGHVELKLRIAVDKINAGISEAENCIAADATHRRLHGCGAPVDEKPRGEYLRSEDPFAHKGFDQIGGRM